MKTIQNLATSFQSLIRLTTALITVTVLLVAAFYLFPLASSLPALSLTISLVAICGLQIALPPIHSGEAF